jgi:hypothetical protein
VQPPRIKRRPFRRIDDRVTDGGICGQGVQHVASIRARAAEFSCATPICGVVRADSPERVMEPLTAYQRYDTWLI